MGNINGEGGLEVPIENTARSPQKHKERVEKFVESGVGELPVVDTNAAEAAQIREIRSTFNPSVETPTEKEGRQIAEQDDALRRQQARDRATRRNESIKKRRRMAFLLTPIIAAGSFIAIHTGLNRQEEVDKQKDAKNASAIFTDEQIKMSRDVHVGEGGNVTDATVSDGTKYSTEAPSDVSGQESSHGN